MSFFLLSPPLHPFSIPVVWRSVFYGPPRCNGQSSLRSRICFIRFPPSVLLAPAVNEAEKVPRLSRTDAARHVRGTRKAFVSGVLNKWGGSCGWRQTFCFHLVWLRSRCCASTRVNIYLTSKHLKSHTTFFFRFHRWISSCYCWCFKRFNMLRLTDRGIWMACSFILVPI